MSWAVAAGRISHHFMRMGDSLTSGREDELLFDDLGLMSSKEEVAEIHTTCLLRGAARNTLKISSVTILSINQLTRRTQLPSA